MRIPFPDKTKLSSDLQDVAILSPGPVSRSLAITREPRDTWQAGWAKSWELRQSWAGVCACVCLLVSDDTAAAQARSGGPSLGHLSQRVALALCVSSVFVTSV